MQVKQEPLSKAALQARAHADAQKEQDKQYTRRAAANLIQRLRENPARTAAFPALAQMINNEAKKSELISLLVTNDGAFDKVGLHLQAYEDAFDGETNRKKALRWSKKEVEDHYGADAEKIMKYKTETGMVEDDENNPGGVLYLISRKEDEAEKGWKRGNLALFSMGHLHNMNLIYFFQARGFPMFHECLMIHDVFLTIMQLGPGLLLLLLMSGFSTCTYMTWGHARTRPLSYSFHDLGCFVFIIEPWPADIFSGDDITHTMTYA